MITKKPLIKFIIWCFILFLICIIGASNVLALEHATTYDDIQTYYDNNGNSVSQVSSTWNSSLNCYVSSGITTTANSYGAGVVINSPIPILTNHTYSLSFAFYQNTYSLALSSKNRIAIGNDIGGTAYNYANGNYYATMNYSKVVNGNILQFAFTASGPASYIFIPWTTASTNTQIYALNTIVIEDLGSSGGVSESTINNSLNNQTNTINNYTYSTIQNSQQAIINNNNSNKQAIIDNNNSNRQAIINNQNANNNALIDSNTQNTQDIINNQNANNQKILDDNKKNFNDCRNSYNLINSQATSQTINGLNIVVNNDKTITINGTATATTDITIITSMTLNAGTYTLTGAPATSGNNTYKLQLLRAGTTKNEIGNGLTFTTTQDYNNVALIIKVYDGQTLNNITFKPMLTLSSNQTNEYEQYGEEICFNKLDEQKNAINNLNDSITNDNVDDSDIGDAFDDFNEFLDDNSTITQLITLPVTLYTAILNNLNSSCSPFNLGNLFGTNLILPCINISQYLGNSLWTMIDIIISGFAIYEIAKKFIKVFNNLSSLREGDVIDD